MANDSGVPTTPVVPSAPTTPAPVAPTSPVTPPASAPVAAPSGEESLTPEQLRDALKNARSEAAQRRIDENEYKALKKEKADREAASLTDQQKLAQRAEQAEALAQKSRARIGASELKLAAQTAGIIDPDVASALLGAQVEYDEDGEPKNVAKLIADLKTAKPHLFTDASGGAQPPKHASSGGATNAGRAAGNAGLNDTIIAAMTPQERLQNLDALRAYQALKYAEEAKKTKTTVQ